VRCAQPGKAFRLPSTVSHEERSRLLVLLAGPASITSSPGNPRMWPWVGPIDAWNVRTGLIRCEQKMARAVIDQLGRRDRNPRHMEYGPMALYHDPPTLVLIRSKPGRTPSPDSQSRSLVLDTPPGMVIQRLPQTFTSPAKFTAGSWPNSSASCRTVTEIHCSFCDHCRVG
jgi:hypothetical protein